MIVLDKERVGIRTFSFDADQGFFLNGKETKFKGVCVHHDGGCLGAAMYREVWLRRLLKLKEGGCNAIRCSHNPHMPELYDLCDELGLLMMDEAFCTYRKMHELIHSGAIGDLKRVNWIITDWYRTQFYYDSGAWRATWAGEGGGVLLNQCPHQLDLVQWLVDCTAPGSHSSHG